MSLDKQRILNELGSVMNQLQSADCGCMGKLFNNGGQGGCAQMGNPLPTCGGCRRGCCPGHGFGVNYASIPGSGEPYSMNAGGMSGGGMHGGMNDGMHGGMQGGMHDGMHGGMQGGMQGGMHEGMHGGMHDGMHGGMRGGMHRGMRNGMQHDGMPMGMGTRNAGMPFKGMNCMMGRNAPGLYADTYNYLNKNMMQPTMQEVYNDLKSITPENTIASNPLATQMGLSASGGNAGGMGGQMPSGGMNMPGAPGNPMSNQNTPQMGGMGANIVNMMMSGGGGRPTSMPQGQGQLKDSMLIDAPNSPHGQVGITPLAAGGNMGMRGMNPGGTLGQPHDGNMGGMPGMGQGNPATMMHNPTTQYVTQDNMHEANAMPQGNVMPQTNAMPVQGMMQGNNMIQGNAMVPGNATQQGNAMQQGNATPQGNAITGNMPGKMMNMKQLNQNPYGHHTAGITKFNEMFPGVMQGDLNFDPMAIAVQMNPANQKQAAIDTMTKLMNGNKGQAMLQPALRGANAALQQVSAAQGGQQQAAQGQQQMPGQEQMPGTTLQPNQQQVYATHTGAPVMNQHMTQQQIPQQQIQGQEHQQIDPNTGAVIEGYEGDPNAPQAGAPAAEQGMTNEPVTAADPSKNTIAYNMTPQYNNVQYNTLGQPVNLLPGRTFHSPTPGLPQTLGGNFRGDLQQEYGVKNTMSKTAIAGTIPLGATASRSQLQHIYRQYRATQNIRPPVQQGGSASAGNLNVTHMNANAAPPTQIPMEKVGGDTIANNQEQPKMEQGMGQVGDAPVASNVPHGDTIQEKSPGAMVGKTRNGLQDMAFTAYRGTTAWSFHG